MPLSLNARHHLNAPTPAGEGWPPWSGGTSCSWHCGRWWVFFVAPLRSNKARAFCGGREVSILVTLCTVSGSQCDKNSSTDGACLCVCTCVCFCVEHVSLYLDSNVNFMILNCHPRRQRGTLAWWIMLKRTSCIASLGFSFLLNWCFVGPSSSLEGNENKATVKWVKPLSPPADAASIKPEQVSVRCLNPLLHHKGTLSRT